MTVEYRVPRLSFDTCALPSGGAARGVSTEKGVHVRGHRQPERRAKGATVDRPIPKPATSTNRMKKGELPALDHAGFAI